MRTHIIRPEAFPEAWASDWGEDEYGLWMAFTYKGIKQAFRWIEPGTFLMGSAEDESERERDETQHEVTLTQGFWLADTTVTQDLWEAVMGDNPSDFKGENHPVETVNWDDVQRFIQQVNSMKPELKLCLPTEAQWEYACRAGTTTRFVFGDEISEEQANFLGSGVEFGKVAVKNYACNDWGLFEMHGNVWEWCADWYAEYPSTPVLDPAGLETGDLRVLRGGSWFDAGRYVRSAYRFSHSLDDRRNRTGFRLARGH